MKIKLSRNYSLCLIAFILVLTSCYKDKGNYDLIEINKVNFVKNGRDTIKINQFDTLKVETTLEQTQEKGLENLSYKWSVFLASSPLTGVIDEVLGTTKNLNIQFGLRPERYTLLYTVTDNNTGVSYFKKYFLDVSSTLSEGWLMISEKKSGERDIDLLHPNGTIIKSLLSAANPGLDIPQKIHTIRVLTTFFGGSQNIFILGENDAMRVKYTDFSKVNGLTDWFVEKPQTVRPQNFSYDMMGMNTFYLDNGQIFSNQVDFRFGAPVEGDHQFSKYIFPQQSSDGAILYDVKNKKFVNYSRKVFSSFSNPADAPFDMNNIGMDVMFAGRSPYYQFSYLMKDENAKPYIFRIHLGGAVGKYPVDNAQKIMNAGHAAFSNLYFHMYYAVDNEIYLLDIENNSSKLVYSFPAGESITAFQLKQSHSSFVSYSDNNRTLAIGTYNGKEGKAYTFSIDNIGEFVDQNYTQIYSNLDKPISLEYKSRK